MWYTTSAMSNTSTREKYKTSKTCSWCPQPRYYNPIKDHTYTLCKKHHEAERNTKRKANARKKELGLCHQCGKQLKNTSVRTCTPCATKYNGYKGVNKTQNR